MFGILYSTFSAFCFVLERYLKRRKLLIVPALACIYLIILMGGQQENPDYEIYRNIFNGSFYSKDPGYGVIIVFLKYIGFTQYNYRLGIALIGLILISITLFKLVNQRVMFYLLYFIYPFLFDVVQARNFLVMSIVIFAIPFLIDTKLKNKIIYILLILVAASVQKIAIVYLPIVFIAEFREKKITKYLFRVILILSLFIAFNRSALIGIMNAIFVPISGQIPELSNYIGVNTNYGWIIFWLEQVFAYALMWYAFEIESQNININEVQDGNISATKQYKFVKLVRDINYYMFIFLPLFILDENYTRIIRNVIPLNLMAIIIVLYRHQKRIYLTKRGLKLLGGTFAYQIIIFILLARTYWDSIILTTFTNNWIFRLF
jgi:hypothetical protein